MMRPDFSRAFVQGRNIEEKNFGSVTFRCHVIGELAIPTGQIIACDPFVFAADVLPFAVQASPGRYPVVLSVASIRDDQRVAYAKLEFRNTPSVRWELALLPGQQSSSLKDDEIFCYPVDSGTGCFMDKYTAELLVKLSDQDENYVQGLMEKMSKTYVDTWDWVDECLDGETGANVITFKSGWGDGCYASYFGYDEDGNITNLITDFAVLDDQEVFNSENEN